MTLSILRRALFTILADEILNLVEMPTLCVNRGTALSEFHQPSSRFSWLMPLKTHSKII
jgi:hypothetical protein